MTSSSTSALRKPAKKSAVKKSSVKKSAAGKPAQNKTGNLPEWNLADLYSGSDAPEVTRDLDRMDADCVAFETDYKGKLAAQIASEHGGKWLARGGRRSAGADDLARGG